MSVEKSIKQANSSNGRGYLLAVVAAVCWGISGTFGQYLYQVKGLDIEWLVTIRLLVSGVILLGLAQIKKNTGIWRIWKSGQDLPQLFLFSIGGMLAVQYTYFIAIRYSNAATATILQYLGPVMIAVYVSMRSKRLPAGNEIVAIVLAVSGTFLLVTHGNPGVLSISGLALFWGISSAFAMVFYSIQPIPLLRRWDAITVIGWGMLIGGIFSSFIHPPWKFEGDWDMVAFLLVTFIIIFATVLAFYAYLKSIQLIGATRASLLAFIEPLSAAFLAVTWLKTTFGWFDWIGGSMIILAVIVLAVNKSGDKSLN